jgi:hypothetical protein
LNSAARFYFGLQFVSVARITNRAIRRDFYFEPVRQTEISLTNGVDDHLIDKMVESLGNRKLINEEYSALCQVENRCMAFAARRMTEDSPFAPVAAANVHDGSRNSAVLRFEIAGSNSSITGRVA